MCLVFEGYMNLVVSVVGNIHFVEVDNFVAVVDTLVVVVVGILVAVDNLVVAVDTLVVVVGNLVVVESVVENIRFVVGILVEDIVVVSVENSQFVVEGSFVVADILVVGNFVAVVHSSPVAEEVH
jgi:hypothetical protein